MAVKLSQPGKMPCKSWSLQAVNTCPGAWRPGKQKQLVAACIGCYATDGNYLFPNTVAVREHNKTDWRRDAWAPEMIAVLSRESYFRWFDSGDMYHIDLARKILEVMRATPNCQHWLPTRMHKFIKFSNIIKSMQKLPNVVVRKSGDGIRGEVIRGKTVSTIFDPQTQRAPAGAHVCPAYQNAGKCGDCRACWNPKIRVIAYPQHGRKMAAVNANVIARG